ncbi:MAG TPA: glycosyltransferase, partial [Brevibacterium sp.]|nr:glycosyltransferase [Brevibacterium sp.]
DLLRGMMDRLPDDVRLAFVGSGPHREELERLFAGTRTVFTGYLGGEQLSAAYASADLFVFPSTTETLGLVALESMASGVPVVAARAGGLPFAVRDGVGGLLHEPGSVEDLTAKVSRVLEDSELRGRLSEGGRQETEKHDWRAATRSLVDGYEEAVERYWSDHRPPGWRMALFGRAMTPARPPLP